MWEHKMVERAEKYCTNKLFRGKNMLTMSKTLMVEVGAKR